VNAPPQVLAGILARAEATKRKQAVAALTTELRAFYYPKQRAYYCSKAKRKATRKTRRAGATAGGCRELIARALEIDGFRATVVHTTRIEARERAWENDTQSGLVDVLRRYGVELDEPGVAKYRLADAITVEVREQELALEFSNGGRIELFGADNERAITKKRGNAKHVFWIDEAQDFQWLERFYKSVVVGALADYKGECWVSGTPGQDCAGMFYEITREDGSVISGCEVHSLAVVDNPFFGGTAEERWENTAGAAKRDNGWADDDPDFQREWLAKWVKTDARFVYAYNQVPEHELVYAPQRLLADGFPDAKAAMLDLPGRLDKKPREYFLAKGVDLGTTGGFAFVVWAWSLKDSNLYELCSWKRAGLDYDEMAVYMKAICSQIYIGLIVGDAGGGGKPAVMGWSKKWVEHYGIPIIEATKTNKAVAIATMNADIRKRRIKFRLGSPLAIEMKSHRWAPIRSEEGKLVEDKKTPNHACDGGLYAHRESYHHRGKEPSLPTLPNTSEWAQREERELEEANCAPQDDPYGW
jgi:hypothetical protein